MQLPCAGLLFIKERKLLLAFSKNKQCYYLPGGKIQAGETARAALCREIKEELNVEIEENHLQYYTHISAPAYGESEGVMMEQSCYWVTKNINPRASNEITQLHYFSLEEYRQQPTTAPGAIKILERLKEDGLID